MAGASASTQLEPSAVPWAPQLPPSQLMSTNGRRNVAIERHRGAGVPSSSFGSSIVRGRSTHQLRGRARGSHRLFPQPGAGFNGSIATQGYSIVISPYPVRFMNSCTVFCI